MLYSPGRLFCRSPDLRCRGGQGPSGPTSAEAARLGETEKRCNMFHVEPLRKTERQSAFPFLRYSLVPQSLTARHSTSQQHRPLPKARGRACPGTRRRPPATYFALRHVRPGAFLLCSPAHLFCRSPDLRCRGKRKNGTTCSTWNLRGKSRSRAFFRLPPGFRCGKLPACPGHGRKAVPNDMCRHLMAHSDQMHSRPQAFYDTLPPREPPAQKKRHVPRETFLKKTDAGFRTEQFKGLFAKREGNFPAFP